MIVVARFNEDISWLDTSKPHFIVQKDEHLENKGRETSSYLWYIVNNYDKLEGTYQFMQGNISDHKFNVFNYECDLYGNPHHGGLPILEIVDLLKLDVPNTLQFTAGAMFEVTAEQIKARSLDWYKNAYEISMTHDKAPWVFERLWKYIFNL